MAKRYKIHPAIGIARVGNSPTSFYIGPEVTAGLPTEIVAGVEKPVTTFRDAARRMKRQAARFRIFEYDDARPNDPGTPVNLGQNGIVNIEWTVYLANKKAIWYEFQELQGEHGYSQKHPLRNPTVTDPAERKKFIIDPGPQMIQGPDARAEFSLGKGQPGYPQNFPPALKPAGITTLGEIRTDEQGRLLVLGGLGNSGTTDAQVKISHYANNNNWFDDIADGPVRATLVRDDGARIPVDAPAWVIVGPPAYAPQIMNMVTLYDVMLDLFIREFGYRPDIFQKGRWNQAYRPNFKAEIEPILRRAAPYERVGAKIPEFAHFFDWVSLGSSSPAQKALRQRIFGMIRSPEAPNQGRNIEDTVWLMPMLAGDNPLTKITVAKYLTLTRTQYFLLKQWADGNFTNTPPGPAPETPGQVLDRAVLENCVGGAFCPGIEVGWIVRNREIYAEPFWIKAKTLTGPGLNLGEDFKQGLEPGDLTKRMALPWQSDFNECDDQKIDDYNVYWWPAQRPMAVYNQDFAVENWTDGLITGPPDSPISDLQMVTEWQNMGFILNQGTTNKPDFIEVEKVDGDSLDQKL